MIPWIKSHLIPHKGNDHHPKILHPNKLRGTLILILFVEIFLFIFPTLINMKEGGRFAATVLPAVVGELANNERQKADLGVLSDNKVLSYAAQLKAQDMASKGYFAHTSPDGKTPWYWLENVGYRYTYAGENLAVNFTDSKDVTNAWMNSPTHRANILKGVYTEMGTGIASGYYKGKKSTFVVQYYARPSQYQANTRTAQMSNTSADERILGAEAEPVGLFKKILSSPRHATNTVFIVIAALIVVAIVLTSIVRLRQGKKADVVSGSLTVLVAILGLFIINYYLSLGEINDQASESSFESTSIPSE